MPTIALHFINVLNNKHMAMFERHVEMSRHGVLTIADERYLLKVIEAVGNSPDRGFAVVSQEHVAEYAWHL